MSAQDRHKRQERAPKPARRGPRSAEPVVAAGPKVGRPGGPEQVEPACPPGPRPSSDGNGEHDEHTRAEEALRESEERFRRLTEASFEAIAVHDKGKILDANQTCATMFGHELSEVVGMHVLDFAAPESRDLILRSMLSRSEEPFEAVGLRKDGSTFTCEVRGKAIPYQGRMVSVTAIRDITERKRAEEALQKTREELDSRVERRMRRGSAYGLTFRELTVLHLVVAGKSDKEIGAVLGITALTASKHLANILHRMGAAGRTEASVRAVREGLLD
jgi:PAS domain S-box-containing protein